jgi:hypothetical protein
MGEEEEDTGAPPTPLSFIDDDSIPSDSVTPKPESKGESMDLIWEGSTLVAADCLALHWDFAAGRVGGKETMKVWKDSWAKGRLVHPPPALAAPPRLAGVEMGRLVEEVVSSRHLRQLLVPRGPEEDYAGRCHSDDIPGSILAEVTDGKWNPFPDVRHGLTRQATTVRPLPPCQIHVGYSGNACELSVAALEYWRQLGVQPVGGKKDVTAFVVCDSAEGDVQAAKTFLQRSIDTYQVRLLHKDRVTKGHGSCLELFARQVSCGN